MSTKSIKLPADKHIPSILPILTNKNSNLCLAEGAKSQLILNLGEQAISKVLNKNIRMS